MCVCLWLLIVITHTHTFTTCFGLEHTTTAVVCVCVCETKLKIEKSRNNINENPPNIYTINEFRITTNKRPKQTYYTHTHTHRTNTTIKTKKRMELFLYPNEDDKQNTNDFNIKPPTLKKKKKGNNRQCFTICNTNKGSTQELAKQRENNWPLPGHPWNRTPPLVRRHTHTHTRYAYQLKSQACSFFFSFFPREDEPTGKILTHIYILLQTIFWRYKSNELKESQRLWLEWKDS